jgi:hypothetical protein
MFDEKLVKKILISLPNSVFGSREFETREKHAIEIKEKYHFLSFGA